MPRHTYLLTWTWYTNSYKAPAKSEYRMFLSGLRRKRPRMLIASTRNPLSALIFMIVRAHSYRIAFPTFLADSVFVAT